MILEAIVTTLDAAGTLNVAPMGPDVAGGMARFTLKPFRTARTYRNLCATGAGVLHVTDDVLLLARAAIHRVGEVESRPAAAVPGRILATTGRYYEFQVVAIDAAADRATIEVETVAEGRQPVDLFGLNRARAAVVEAAILATRLDFLPIAEVRAEFDRLAIPIGKTGGPDEHRAFDLLRTHVEGYTLRSGTASGLDAGRVS